MNILLGGAVGDVAESSMAPLLILGMDLVVLFVHLTAIGEIHVEGHGSGHLVVLFVHPTTAIGEIHAEGLSLHATVKGT